MNKPYIVEVIYQDDSTREFDFQTEQEALVMKAMLLSTNTGIYVGIYKILNIL